MKLVVIESPFAGDVEANVEYARRCAKDCLARGESPYASHLFFTQRGILDDDKPEERKLGIEAGLAWARAAEAVVVYIDRGISGGMRQGIARHLKNGKAIYVRSLERELSVQEIGGILSEVQQHAVHTTTKVQIEIETLPAPPEPDAEATPEPAPPEPESTEPDEPVLVPAPAEEDVVIYDDGNIPF
jgi:hypothetical protein